MSSLLSDPIVTIDSPSHQVLFEKTLDFHYQELSQAAGIGETLIESLAVKGPAAGLAAPQIGISRSVFIYSFDRDPRNLEVVINPSYEPASEDTTLGWEVCFSAELKPSKVSRYDTIDVTYLNIEGELVSKRLSGFAAKVFQHEYDHLQGTLVCCKEEAEVVTLETKEQMIEFMTEVKKEDAKRY